MTPANLEQIIAWTFPRRNRRRGKLGVIDPFRKGAGANKKFAALLGLSEAVLRSYRTGRKPIPKWLIAAIQGLALPIIPGTGLGSTMAETPRPIKIDGLAYVLGGAITHIVLSGDALTNVLKSMGRESLGLDEILNIEDRIQEIVPGYHKAS